jgi:radical SAM superfamily enzyme YgiQ (UPF0313 family)
MPGNIGQMKILFLKPAMHPLQKSQGMQPLAFAVLSALTPPEIERAFYDENIESIPLDEQADLVAMSVETFTAKRAYQIAEIYKKQNIPVIMGGFHPTIEPEEVLEHASSVAIGDAEAIWPRVLSDFKDGILKKIYRSITVTDTIKTSYDRSIFKDKKYSPFNLVQWSRGCKFHCEFCSVKTLYPGNQISRPISEVIGEIKELDNKPLFIVDDNIYQNRTGFTEFLLRITSLKKKWGCQISLDITKDDDLMELLGKSGCIMVIIGIESLNMDDLHQMNKISNLAINDYESAINKFRKYGIMIYGTYIFGYDHDDGNQFEKAVNFAKRMKFAVANFNTLYPMPGTDIYVRLKNENRLLYEKWWLDDEFYFGKAMFQPVFLSPEELEDGCFRAKRSFNSIVSIIYRMLDFRCNSRNLSNFILHLILNLTNRRQIYKKQGKALVNIS